MNGLITPPCEMKAVIANEAVPGLSALIAKWKGARSERVGDLLSRLFLRPRGDTRQALTGQMVELVRQHPVLGTYSKIELWPEAPHAIQVYSEARLVNERLYPDQRLATPGVVEHIKSLEIRTLDLPAGDWPPGQYECSSQQLEGKHPVVKANVFVELAEVNGARGTRYNVVVALIDEEDKEEDLGTFYVLASAVRRSLVGIHTWRKDNSPVPSRPTVVVATAPTATP